MATLAGFRLLSRLHRVEFQPIIQATRLEDRVAGRHTIWQAYTVTSYEKAGPDLEVRRV